MKTIKFKLSSAILVLLVGVLFFISCSDNEETFPQTRLFRPVLNEQLLSENNTIIIDMGKMKEAISYQIEISRDTFQTIVETINTKENYYIVEDLLWNTIYQVRATAYASEAEYNSKVSDLGNVSTQRFPSIMGIPTEYDVTDVAGRVFWTTAGAAVTGVKVFALADEALENPLFEYTVTSEDQEMEEKIVPGLEPATEYQLAIYSDTGVRGWEKYTTKEALPSGSDVVDLRGITDNPAILVETLPTVADGTTILLEGGYVYDMSGGYSYDKSITIKSGYSFDPAGATLELNSNFNLVENSNVASIVFEGLTLRGQFGSKYVFNIDKSGTIGEIKFNDCKIRLLRAVTRIKGGAGVLDKYTFDNCIIDSIQGYGILTVDKDSWQANDIMFKNTTISRAQMFLVSKNNSNTITLEDCTLSEVPEQGRQLFRWRQGGQDDVLNGIFFKNTIIGRGWNQEDEESYGIDGFDGMGNTNWNIVNSYATGDFSIKEGKDEIPGFPNFWYSKTILDLWADPVNVDFNFIDSSFQGIADSGDSRWRIGL